MFNVNVCNHLFTEIPHPNTINWDNLITETGKFSDN